MSKGGLGKEYADGETIIRQGETGDSMYVIQEGQVEVIAHHGDREVRLALRGPGEFVGEMALFEREVRSADVRAVGPTRVLTVDRKNLLRRIHEDPSLAFRMIEAMSRRIRELSLEVARLNGQADSR